MPSCQNLLLSETPLNQDASVSFVWIDESLLLSKLLIYLSTLPLQTAEFQTLESTSLMPLHDGRQRPSLFTAVAASRQARPDRDPNEALARKRLQIFSDNCPKRPRSKCFSLFFGIINKSGLATLLSPLFCEASMVTGAVIIHQPSQEYTGLVPVLFQFL